MKKIAAMVMILSALVAVVVTGVTLSPSAVLAQGGTDTRVLVWESSPTDDGFLSAIASGGAEDVLVDFPADNIQGNYWAKRCGQDFWSASGQGATLFVGGEQGEIAIYPLAGGAPVVLGQAHRMACAGPATFQFSPNHSRVGYINYDATSLDGEYAHGDLIFFDAATGAQLATFERANSFVLYDDGALMFRIFPDGKGYGAEADLEWWDGSGRRTLTTIEPVTPSDIENPNCGIKVSSAARLGDTAYVLMGQRCDKTSENTWRLMSVPMAGGPVTEIAAGQPRRPDAGYFNESFTLNLIPAQDGSGFLMSTPSGLSRNSVGLQWITPGGAITPILEDRHVLVERFGERLSEGRLLMSSMDGGALSFVTVTNNGDQTLWLMDLSTVGTQPVLVEDEGAGQRIFQHAWSSTNTLYYIAGSVDSNSLHMIMPGGSSQRLERGRFFRLAVSYDGNKLGVAEWYANPNSIGDDLFKLNVFDTSGNAFVLKQGGEEHNQMIPLAIQ